MLQSIGSLRVGHGSVTEQQRKYILSSQIYVFWPNFFKISKLKFYPLAWTYIWMFNKYLTIKLSKAEYIFPAFSDHESSFHPVLSNFKPQNCNNHYLRQPLKDWVKQQQWGVTCFLFIISGFSLREGSARSSGKQHSCSDANLSSDHMVQQPPQTCLLTRCPGTHMHWTSGKQLLVSSEDTLGSVSSRTEDRLWKSDW